jgi:hypothetical protein
MSQLVSVIAEQPHHHSLPSFAPFCDGDDACGGDGALSVRSLS